MNIRGVQTPKRSLWQRKSAIALSLLVSVSVVAAGCSNSDSTSETSSTTSAPSSTGESNGEIDGQFGIPEFYEPPSPLPSGEHGELIRKEEIDAPEGARAWRILYLSELHDGTPVAVSGFVVAPEGAAPEGGRKVVAWAHGTEGGGRNCAPSLAPKPAVELVDYFTYTSTLQQDSGVPALSEMLEAGYVVVATDYQGLGTPGIQQYTVLESESNNIWDSVKAAQKIDETGAGDDMVVLGWSQGGGASVWMSQNQDYGAPLRLLGTAGLAPAADNGPQFARQVPPGPSNATSPAHAVALQLNVFRGLAAAYPELKVSDVVTKAGEEAMVGAAQQCISHLAYVINSNLTTPPGETLLNPNIPADWQQRLNENTVGYSAPKVPVLVMQGTADTVVNPNGTTQYIARACGFGQPVEYTMYEGATHQTIPNDSKSEYLEWFADRFDGIPAPSNCAPPGSPQTAPSPIPTPAPLIPAPTTPSAPAPTP